MNRTETAKKIQTAIREHFEEAGGPDPETWADSALEEDFEALSPSAREAFLAAAEAVEE